MSVPGKYGNEHPGKYESRKVLSLLMGTRFITWNLIGWQQIRAFWIGVASFFGPDCFLVHIVQPYLRSLFGVRAKLNVCGEIEDRMMVGLVGKPNLHCVGLTCVIRFWKQSKIKETITIVARGELLTSLVLMGVRSDLAGQWGSPRGCRQNPWEFSHTGLLSSQGKDTSAHVKTKGLSWVLKLTERQENIWSPKEWTLTETS